MSAKPWHVCVGPLGPRSTKARAIPASLRISAALPCPRGAGKNCQRNGGGALFLPLIPELAALGRFGEVGRGWIFRHRF